MTENKPCATCGKPTRSHTIAIDVSEHDQIGLPTLIGMVCHQCWTGDTDGVAEVGAILGDRDALLMEVDRLNMTPIATPVEEIQ